MAKKVKIDPVLEEAAVANASDGRDVLAEQQTKAITLETLTEDERREVVAQRQERNDKRLAEQAEMDRTRDAREKEREALVNKPLTATERERLDWLEERVRGHFPKGQPHPPLGRVQPEMMRELSVLRRRAKIPANKPE